jgi:hypothetical protein
MSSVRLCNPLAPWVWLRALLYVSLATSLTATNSYFVHNLTSDLPGVADQEDDALINPWDFIAFDTCTPVGSLCTPPDVSSVLVASNGNGTVVQYTPIPGIVQPNSYPSLLHGVTGIMGNYGLPQRVRMVWPMDSWSVPKMERSRVWRSSCQLSSLLWSITRNLGRSIKAVPVGACSRVADGHATMQRISATGK